MAIRLDADTDPLTYSGAVLTGNVLTVLCWGRIAVDRDDYSNFVSLHNATSPSRTVSLTLEGDGTTLRSFDNGLQGPTGSSLTVGVWYAMAAAVNGANCTLYWGTTAGSLSTNTVGTFAAPGEATDLLYIGRNQGGFWLNGSVANVKIYDAELNSSEVAAELGQYAAVRTANLVARYPFTTVDLTDASGNGHTLTAGATSVTADDGPPELDPSGDSLRLPIQTIRVP